MALPPRGKYKHKQQKGVGSISTPNLILNLILILNPAGVLNQISGHGKDDQSDCDSRRCVAKYRPMPLCRAV
ncbi:uncharacterized protein SPSK_03817 [Sporothrix schenckii 1099-18]|uniref:Uncharacterized protein n=1 Tax=Sporothrix schenckii 1099-18 TaxID=1397361 RepID=A0A0F2M1G7_SPOSC|nr:uncharacterized protein SPSK_03817 [Sporothrix schenckii 1099-18]KJR81986.1 hypothetical protein SPSK_03817 [Sporothrix schenckii 1099-18]